MAIKIYPDAGTAGVDVRAMDLPITIYLEDESTITVPAGETRSIQLVDAAVVTVVQETGETRAYAGPGPALAQRLAYYWNKVADRLVREEKALPKMAKSS